MVSLLEVYDDIANQVGSMQKPTLKHHVSFHFIVVAVFTYKLCLYLHQNINCVKSLDIHNTYFQNVQKCKTLIAFCEKIFEKLPKTGEWSKFNCKNSLELTNKMQAEKKEENKK